MCNTRAEIVAQLHKQPQERLTTAPFRKHLLLEAERLWQDLQRDELGGYSGINRPFHIRNVFEQICLRLLGLEQMPKADPVVTDDRMWELMEQGLDIVTKERDELLRQLLAVREKVNG